MGHSISDSGLFATSAWVDRWIQTHSGAGRLAEGFLVWCLFHKANQKPDGQPASTSTSTIIPYQSIGEAFAHGTELVWELLQVMRSRGCTRQIRRPEDVHLGCFLICWLFFCSFDFCNRLILQMSISHNEVEICLLILQCKIVIATML